MSDYYLQSSLSSVSPTSSWYPSASGKDTEKRDIQENISDPQMAEEAFELGLRVGELKGFNKQIRQLKETEAVLQDAQAENKQLRYYNSTAHDDMLACELSFHKFDGGNSQAEAEARRLIAGILGQIKETRDRLRKLLEYNCTPKCDDAWEKLSRKVQYALDQNRMSLADFIKTQNQENYLTDALTQCCWGLSYVLEIFKLLIDSRAFPRGSINIKIKREPLKESG